MSPASNENERRTTAGGDPRTAIHRPAEAADRRPCRPTDLRSPRDAAIGFGYGLVAGTALYCYFAPTAFLSTPRHILLWLLMAGLIWLPSFWALSWVRRSLSDRSTIERSIWGSGSIAFALLLLLAIPVPRPTPFWLGQQTLEIVALEQKNPLSNGTEVWVFGLGGWGGSHLGPESFRQDGRWNLQDGAYVSFREKPARLEWTGPVDGAADLLLRAHSWSGMAEVRWNGTSQRVDLYHPETIFRHIELKAASVSGPAGSIYRAGVLACQAVALGGILFGVSILLAGINTPASTAVHAGRATLVYALPCLLAWGLALVAYLPALMSSDSMDQWEQVLSGEFWDDHPAFHTMTLWVATRGTASPTAAVAVQIVLCSLACGWSVGRMRQLGAPRWLAVLVILAVAVSPVNLAMMSTLWKDVLFSTAVLVLTVLVLSVVTSRGEWLNRPTAWGALGATVAVVSLYRHNGIVPAFGTLLAVLVLYPRYWRRTTLALLLGLGLVWGVRGPLYQVCGVQPSRVQGWVWTFIHQVAAHVNAGTPMTAEEQAFLHRLRRDDRWPYDPYFVNPLLYDGQFDALVAQAERREVARLAGRLFMRNPRVTLGHMLNQSALVWRIRKPPESNYWATLGVISGDHVEIMSPYPNRMGLEPRPLSSSWSFKVAGYVTALQRPPLLSLLWRPALPLYVFLGAVCVLWARSRSWRVLVVLGPVLINSLIIALLTPAQDFRYQYPAVLVSLVVSPFLLFAPISAEKDDRLPAT